MWSFADTFSALSESVAATVAGPESPVGYGSDLACDAVDVTPDFAERDGSDPLLVVESFVRMITTPRGSLPDAPGEGIDIRGYLHSGLTQADIVAMRSAIVAQAQNDDRIDSVQVAVTPSPDGSELSIEISGQIAGSTGPFKLVLALTDSAALIQELTA